MAGQKFERVIVEPPHAAFGYPLLSGFGLGIAGWITAAGYFPAAFAFMVGWHALSIWLRRRHPHGEAIALRRVKRGKTYVDWQSGRRVYWG